jgi:hypothetical protein
MLPDLNDPQEIVSTISFDNWISVHNLINSQLKIVAGCRQKHEVHSLGLFQRSL